MKSGKESCCIRFAVIGARRGRGFVEVAKHLPSVKLVAVCDLRESALEEWRKEAEIRCHSDFEQVLNDPDVDAVCIATPVLQHAKQAVAALKAGKHVLSEVTAAYTLEECHELVEAVEKSGLTYMMAENYCFRREVLMVQNMVEQGVFGDLVYATGSYIHHCLDLVFTKEGNLTWRGELLKEATGNFYPTHGLGPVCRWLGINRTDFLKTTATWQSRSAGLSRYSKMQQPNRTEYAEPDFWKQPDTFTTLLRTERGVLVESRFDATSTRPHNMARYELQGANACFTTPANALEEPLVWIDGRSPASETGTPRWEPLYKYAEEFEHPWWREHGARAKEMGHNGSDFFSLREFVEALLEERAPLIDVYDSVTWSSIGPLSRISIAQNNAAVDVPNFKNKK